MTEKNVTWFNTGFFFPWKPLFIVIAPTRNHGASATVTLMRRMGASEASHVLS